MDIAELKEKMEKAIDNMSSQLCGVHSANISSGLVDTLKVNYYGQPTPIKKIAQTSDTASGISIQPFEKDLYGQIITALKQAGLDAYPFSKSTVMVNRPKPSGEEKIKVKNQIYHLGEEAKVAVRQIRHNFRQHLDGSEDDVKNGERLAQHYTDHACRMIDEIVNEKCEKI